MFWNICRLICCKKEIINISHLKGSAPKAEMHRQAQLTTMSSGKFTQVRN